jgi:hypothetical protein
MKKLLLYRLNILTICSYLIIAYSACTLPTTSHKQIANTYPGLVSSSLSGCNLIEEDGQINEHLLEFLKLFEINHQGTVKSVNEAMQQHFIRKSGTERWHLVDTSQDQALRQPALELLRQMGFVEAIPYFKAQSDYFLLFGAKLARMEQRFKDFLDQSTQGTLQCKNIVLLGGVRKLMEDEIATIQAELGTQYDQFLKSLDKQPTDLTEADALRFIWQTKATTDLKTQFQEGKNLFFVNSTDITQGTNQRPTTGSTIEAWFADFKPTPGVCHANVEKPYGIRMEKNLRLLLEKHHQALGSTNQKFSITWNSPAASNSLLLTNYKDELARTFYQEYALKKYLGMIKD